MFALRRKDRKVTGGCGGCPPAILTKAKKIHTGFTVRLWFRFIAIKALRSGVPQAPPVLTFRCPPRSLCSLPALATAARARLGCRQPAPPGLAPGGLRPPPYSVSSTIKNKLYLYLLNREMIISYQKYCHHRRHARYSRSSMRNPAPCATRTAGTGSTNPWENERENEQENE